MASGGAQRAQANATDYLLTGTVTDAQPISNVRLLERFRALAQCELAEQEAVIRLIDAVVVKHRVESAMQPLGSKHPAPPHL